MKKVIVTRGPKRVFNTLEEASEALGKSVSALSVSIREKRGDVMYVNRVFVGKYKDRRWTGPMVVNARNSGYILLGDEMKVVKRGELVEIREITADWYANGTEFDSKAR